MSAIVDGGLYREEDFMLKFLFPQSLIDDRNAFVLVAGGIMVGVACLSMIFGLLSARLSAIAGQAFPLPTRTASPPPASSPAPPPMSTPCAPPCFSFCAP